MQTNYLIAMDIETGGISNDISILSAYFTLIQRKENGDMVQLDELDLKIKPNDGIYRITAESLDINKINLVEHDKVAVFTKLAGQQLYKKIQDWFFISKEKLIPVGHNVGFDIRKITTDLISIGSWENFVSYRVLDTCTIAQFLRLRGDLPKDLSCSLVNLSNYFNVEVDGLPHEAKYDTLSTVKVLENLLKVS